MKIEIDPGYFVEDESSGRVRAVFAGERKEYETDAEVFTSVTYTTNDGYSVIKEKVSIVYQ